MNRIGEIIEQCVITTDGYGAYAGVIRDLMGEICVYAHVIKTWRDNRTLKVAQQLIIGTPEQLTDALIHSEDSPTVNTSYVERLNVTIRQCCPYLGRRRLSHAHGQEQREGHLNLV